MWKKMVQSALASVKTPPQKTGFAFEQLTIQIGPHTLLSNLTFQHASQGLIALMGKQGSGKSTLLRALGGVLRPQQGIARLNGHNLADLTPLGRAKQIAWVSPYAQSYGRPDLYEFVMQGYRLQSGWQTMIPSEEADHAVREALKAVNLLSAMKHPYHQLSNFQRHQAALAKAIVQNTPIILIDQADLVGNAVEQHEFMHLLQSQTQHGRCIVAMLEHPEHAQRYADSFIYLEDSSTVHVGPMRASTSMTQHTHSPQQAHLPHFALGAY